MTRMLRNRSIARSRRRNRSHYEIPQARTCSRITTWLANISATAAPPAAGRIPQPPAPGPAGGIRPRADMSRRRASRNSPSRSLADHVHTCQTLVAQVCTSLCSAQKCSVFGHWRDRRNGTSDTPAAASRCVTAPGPRQLICRGPRKPNPLGNNSILWHEIVPCRHSYDGRSTRDRP